MQGVEATTEGVLGGYSEVDAHDVADSRIFLRQYFKAQLEEAARGERRLVALGAA